MANYQKNADNALKSIAKAGKKFTIFRPVLLFNDVTGIPNDRPTLTGEITAVVLPYSKSLNALDDRMKEALIAGKLRKVLAAAKGAPFSPLPLDIIVIDGTNWQVIGNTPLAPDGITPIIFTMAVIQCGSFTPTPEDG
jgi:hypothetical protein